MHGYGVQKPYTKVVKSVAPGSGSGPVGQSQSGHIVKM